LLNAVPLLGAWAAAAKLADDRNVIAFWKILVGVPLFAVWASAAVISSIASGHAGFALAYVAITAFGLSLYYRTKKVAVAVYNGVFRASERPKALAYRDAVLAALKQTGTETAEREVCRELYCFAE
jgi:hypothetical protein